MDDGSGEGTGLSFALGDSFSGADLKAEQTKPDQKS